MRIVVILLLLGFAAWPAVAQPATEVFAQEAPAVEAAADAQTDVPTEPAEPAWWDDRDFLRTIAPFVGALVGFLGGTVVNHLLSLWRDAIRRRHEANGLRSGIMGELRANELYLITKRKRLTEHREILAEGEAGVAHVQGVTESMIGYLAQEPSDEVFRSSIDRLPALTPGEIGLIITLYSRLKQEDESTKAWSQQISAAHGTAEMLDGLEQTFESQLKLIYMAIQDLRQHQLGPAGRALAWIATRLNRRIGLPKPGA